MKPESKVFVIIFGYCVILWATNWSLSHEYSREVGLTAASIDMRGLGALIGLIASIILGRRIWRVVRALFDMQVRIPMTRRLWSSWGYLWLLLPLTFGKVTHSYGTTEDGAAIKTIFEYGGSWASPLFSGLAIMLFQLLIRLEAFNPINKSKKQNKALHPTARSRPVYQRL